MAPSVEDILSMTDEDWEGLRLSQKALLILREDLTRRLGVSAQHYLAANLRRHFSPPDFYGNSQPATVVTTTMIVRTIWRL